MSADNTHRRRRLNPAEHALWSEVIRSVVPLRGRAAYAEATVSESSAKKIARAQTVEPQTSPTLSRRFPPIRTAEPALAPLERRVRQRLARGAIAIDARLDLHGQTQADARVALQRFLHTAQEQGAKVVLVITGKGGRDPASERGVLKRQVPAWLGLPELRRYVIGFEDAHIGHGGEGALYVRVRRTR